MLRKFSKKRDLTAGSISKAIWILAIPMIFSNLFQTAFDLVDMAWVGRLGAEALAAVSMSGYILMIVMFLMMGLGVGTTALVARSIGAGNQQQADNIAMQSLIMGLIGSVALAVLGYVYSPWLLEILGARPDVLTLAAGYLRITFSGVIVMFYAFLVSAILQGAGDAVTPMLILVFSSAINIVLDPLLIFGIGIFPKMGVNGAALASVIARGIGSLIALDVLFRGRSRVHVKMKHLKIDWDAIWKIFKIGIPASGQMSLRGLVGIALIAVVAGFGTPAVAAYGVGMRLFMISMMPGFALGMASATLVGQNLGARQEKRASRSAWAAVGYYSIFMLAMSYVFIRFAPDLILIFNDNPEVVSIGSGLLRTIGFGNIFIAFGLVLNRSLSGAGDTFIPMLITFVSLWLVQIPLAVYLSRMPALGIRGVWYAVLAAYIMQGVLTAAWFQLGRWKYKKV